MAYKDPYARVTLSDGTVYSGTPEDVYRQIPPLSRPLPALPSAPMQNAYYGSQDTGLPPLPAGGAAPVPRLPAPPLPRGRGPVDAQGNPLSRAAQDFLANQKTFSNVRTLEDKQALQNTIDSQAKTKAIADQDAQDRATMTPEQYAMKKGGVGDITRLAVEGTKGATARDVATTKAQAGEWRKTIAEKQLAQKDVLAQLEMARKSGDATKQREHEITLKNMDTDAKMTIAEQTGGSPLLADGSPNPAFQKEFENQLVLAKQKGELQNEGDMQEAIVRYTQNIMEEAQKAKAPLDTLKVVREAMQMKDRIQNDPNKTATSPAVSQPNAAAPGQGAAPAVGDANQNGIPDRDEQAAMEADRLMTSPESSGDVERGTALRAEILRRNKGKEKIIDQFVANRKKAVQAK